MSILEIAMCAAPLTPLPAFTCRSCSPKWRRRAPDSPGWSMPSLRSEECWAPPGPCARSEEDKFETDRDLAQLRQMLRLHDPLETRDYKCFLNRKNMLTMGHRTIPRGASMEKTKVELDAWEQTHAVLVQTVNSHRYVATLSERSSNLLASRALKRSVFSLHWCCNMM